LVREGSICLAPQYVAEDLLKAEGFAQVEYVPVESVGSPPAAIASGKADLIADVAPAIALLLDAGEPITVLAGIHAGCYELFGTDRVRTIRDLKGKTVAISGARDDRHVFVASMAAHVGIDPRRDINWVTHSGSDAMRLFAEGKIDAFLGFPPEPQELRAKKIGHVVLNTLTDRPWSQYFCCMAAGNRDFVRKHPVATKRALRAILKAAAMCSLEPARVARFLVDKGYTDQHDYALQTLREIPFSKWREYNPEDTLRFYALRLNEAGMVKSTPQKLIAQGADWRFLNELKKELKA